ncbi:phosphatidylglycerol lysyltransferase domain-containing protein [Streptomyces hiroshimensis]|uniref:Membrane protein n=1 Tax=Streptomyces hiroshimensis TaxID=66424 RepID=A0ABQ2ZCA0_9ACTN|nr:phosphatidylglycerol lysyltransferase domain-containing protein [Streptomyces hiroshimensis]GGY10430.1 membrane protein [Streptomyces hiroshimensis]
MSVRVDGKKSDGVPEGTKRLSRLARIVRGPKPENVPAVVGTVAALIGLVDVLAGVVPRFRWSKVHSLAEVLPGSVTQLAAAGSIIVGILLLMLAHGLKRAKQRAWLAAVVLLPIGAAAQLVYRHSYIGAILSLLLFIYLVWHKSSFYALPDPRSRWKVAANFILMGAFSFGLGWVIVGSHPDQMIGDPPVIEQIEHVIWGLFGFEGSIRYTEHVDYTVGYSLGALGLLTVATTAYLAFMPAYPAAVLTEEDEDKLRELLAKHGARDSLGHFALRRDKSAVFSPSGKAAVSYRVVSGVMLASGDPIGDVEAWPGAIEKFMELAKRHSWTPAVAGCSETGGEVWTRETGLDALEMGDEAIVEVADFSLTGRSMRNVRQMVKRIERNGYSTKVRRVGDLSPEELEAVQKAANAWRDTEDERGFSMALGRIGDPKDLDAIIATAHKDPEEGEDCPFGDLRAMQHYVPWGPDGSSLELMRRDRSADPGMNELLIVAFLQAAPELKVKRLSLNFAFFRSALERGGKLGAGPVVRIQRSVLVFLSRWFQIESLYKFNEKFRPRWEPRFIVFPNSRDLPRIGFAMMQAEGFLELPRLLRRRPAPPKDVLEDADEQVSASEVTRAA